MPPRLSRCCCAWASRLLGASALLFICFSSLVLRPIPQSRVGDNVGAGSSPSLRTGSTCYTGHSLFAAAAEDQSRAGGEAADEATAGARRDEDGAGPGDPRWGRAARASTGGPSDDEDAEGRVKRRERAKEKLARGETLSASRDGGGSGEARASNDGAQAAAHSFEENSYWFSRGPWLYLGGAPPAVRKAGAPQKAGPENIASLLNHVGGLNRELALDLQGKQILTTQIIDSTALALNAKSQQLGGLEKAIGTLKSNARLGQWRIGKFLDLMRVRAAERQALFLDRLNNVRDRINGVAGSVVLQTMGELRGVVEYLRSDADALLLGEKYSSRFKQVELQVQSNATKLQELRGTLEQARARVSTWADGISDIIEQMGRNASLLVQAGQERFVDATALILKQKEEEFSLVLSTPRVELTYVDMVVDRILSDFKKQSVSIVDLSSWLINGNKSGAGLATVDEVATRLLARLRRQDPHLNVRPVFCYIPPYAAVRNLDRMRFHVVPTPRTIQMALAQLQKAGIPRGFSLVSFNQVLVEAQVVAFDKSGRRATSALALLDPRDSDSGGVVLSRTDVYGLAFQRSLAGPNKALALQALRATGQNAKVLIVFAGERPATTAAHQASLMQRSVSYLTEAGLRAYEFATYSRAPAPELERLTRRLNAELRFFTTIERNCNKRLVSAQLPEGAEEWLRLPPVDLGLYRIYHSSRTAVLASFSDVPLPALPLSSLFRSSVAILRLEIARSRHGRREYAAPPRAALTHALLVLLAQPIDGDAVVTVHTQVTSDTRLSWVKRKRARASVVLSTSVGPPLYVSSVAIADFRSDYVAPKAILESVADYVARNFLSQNFVKYRHKLEGRVVYIQICLLGVHC
ncbi:hypothetical protein BESB_070400 [Besnoitia besnoiti]|uniref:Uncharacterized protein n=1 Tax=Besnoitia besnoiti TaxID=94643 RepID=A0A2A9M5Y3_BESBE|nr:uncharacterized protein BESB_070400 [Besnoitia besnoiti]PFH33888.1 hypothetical protein BESB_070400 [Besnoitia besnoiti]